MRRRSHAGHVLVVVPAHDEEERIGATLASVAVARRCLPSSVSSRVVVVADASSDATARIARLMRRPGDLVVETAHGCVGLARRAGTHRGLSSSPCGPQATWIASTDADSVVPPDWLLGHLHAARAGFVGVAGVVDLVDHEADGHTLARFRASYATNDDGSHPHVHGANLGVRADAYLAAGGWGALATGEDHDLWRRVQQVGPTLATAAVRVMTSARRIGRAPAGFAADLAALDAAVA